MLELLKDFGLKALGIVAPFVVAWFYSPEKIASDIKFRVRGEGDGVTFEGGELPKVRVWLLVSNLSPFNIEVDRMVIQLVYGSVIGEVNDVRRRTLPCSKEAEWLVESTLNDKQLAYIQRNMENKPETRLTVTAFINTSLHKFESSASVGTGNVRFLNLLARQAVSADT
jgi:hypothetical protein